MLQFVVSSTGKLLAGLGVISAVSDKNYCWKFEVTNWQFKTCLTNLTSLSFSHSFISVDIMCFFLCYNIIANSAEQEWVLICWRNELWHNIITLRWYEVKTDHLSYNCLVTNTAFNYSLLWIMLITRCCFAFIALGQSFLFAGGTACREEIAGGGSDHECGVCWIRLAEHKTCRQFIRHRDRRYDCRRFVVFV